MYNTYGSVHEILVLIASAKACESSADSPELSVLHSRET